MPKWAGILKSYWLKKQNVLPQKQSKERILRAAQEKGQVKYKGRHIRITPDISLETMKARKSWSSIMQTLRDYGCQYRLLYLAKLSIT